MEYEFAIEKVWISIGTHTSASVNTGEDPVEQIGHQLLFDIGTDIEITISGVTMFWSAWADPDHWNEEWQGVLECDYDEVPARVAELIAAAAKG